MKQNMDREEAEEFSAEETDFGRQAGLVLYNKLKEELLRRGIAVFVFTIREDDTIREAFLNAGLPDGHFMTKSDGADTAVFLEKIRELLEGS